LTLQDTYRWNGNTIGDLLKEFFSRIKGRRSDRRAHIGINDNGSDRVQNYLTDLQQSQCPWEIIDILQKNSENMVKKATWPAYAKTMLAIARHASCNAGAGEKSVIRPGFRWK
jgi:hypothetical protein